MSSFISFSGANGQRRFVRQEDSFDDSTRCDRCGVAETLGYICDACDKVHCSGCLPYDAHACAVQLRREAAAQKEAAARPPTSVPSFSPCNARGCTERVAVAITCRTCNKTFCPTHKMEEDHGCSAPKALQAAKVPHHGRKDANRLVAPAGLHVDDRYLLTVHLPPVYGRPSQSVAVHKRWGVGKGVDFVLKEFGRLCDAAGQGSRYVLVRCSTLDKLPLMSSFQQLAASGKLGKRSDEVLLVPEAWYTEAKKQIDASALVSCAQQASWTCLLVRKAEEISL